MVGKETTASPAEQVRPDLADSAGVVGHAIVGVLVVTLYGLIMATWHPGLSGDLLLATTTSGFLFCVPYAVSIWAGLALFLGAAIVLIARDEAVASRVADLAFLGLLVGCVWAIWSLALDSRGWRHPGTVLYEYLRRASAYPYLLAATRATTTLAAAWAVVQLVGSVGILLLALTVVGIWLGLRGTVALWAGSTLAAATALLYLAGYRTLAASAAVLAVGAFVAALLWFSWRFTVTALRLRRTAPLGLPVGGATPGGEGEQETAAREWDSSIG